MELRYLLIIFLLTFSNEAISFVLSQDTLNSKERFDHYYDLSFSNFSVDADTVEYYAHQCLQIATELDDDLRLSSAYQCLGKAEEMRGDFEEALDYYYRSLHLRTALGNQIEMLSSKVSIANVGLYQGIHYEAEELWDEAMAMYESADSAYALYYEQARSLNDSFFMSVCAQNLGTSAFRLMEYRDAIKYFQKGYHEAPDSLKKQKYVEAQLNIFAALYEDGNADALRNEFERLKNEFEQNESWYFLGTTFLNYAALAAIESPEIVDSLYKEAIKIGDKYGLMDIKKKALNHLFLLYESTEDYENAYRHLKEYRELDVATQLANAQEKIEELEVKYQTETLRTSYLEEQDKHEKTKMRTRVISLGFGAGLIIALLILGFFAQKAKANEARLKESQARHNKKVTQIMSQHETQIIDAMMDSQEAERKRISENLHDNIGSLLVATRMQLENEAESNNDQSLNKITAMLDKAIEETRGVSYNLYSLSLAKFGLKTALLELRDHLATAGKTEIIVSADEEGVVVNQTVQHHLFRIAQEAISNALKYSEATVVHVVLKPVSEDFAYMTINDNGKGFHQNKVEKGMGLINMKNRSRKINGVLKVDSSPGKGTTINIEFPNGE